MHGGQPHPDTGAQTHPHSLSHTQHTIAVIRRSHDTLRLTCCCAEGRGVSWREHRLLLLLPIYDGRCSRRVGTRLLPRAMPCSPRTASVLAAQERVAVLAPCAVCDFFLLLHSRVLARPVCKLRGRLSCRFQDRVQHCELALACKLKPHV